MFDPPVIAYAPILYGGAVSWVLEPNRDIDLAEVLSKRVFDDESVLIGKILVALGSVTEQLNVPMLNGSPLFLVLLQAESMAERRYPAAAALAAARETLRESLEDLKLTRPASQDGPAIIAEITQAIRLSLLAVKLLESRLLTRDPNLADVQVAQQLSSELDTVLESQREAWLLSSRPGGLSNSIARLDPLKHALTARACFLE
ncbi:hypothetical protein [Arthrobacter alpinus]|uniref:hypothetical protein n=1 Tax=Arthrobacter alpinus TaxID=656366 RepID=UPI001114E634|nr:hypothetical protein [Arthrobacter alpinus]